MDLQSLYPVEDENQSTNPMVDLLREASQAAPLLSLTEEGDFHYRHWDRFDPVTGGAEKNFRAATVD